jgi:hypothetical protein
MVCRLALIFVIKAGVLSNININIGQGFIKRVISISMSIGDWGGWVFRAD